MPTGKLITLEGIDGTGKSSIAKFLKKRFPDAVFTREPTQSWIGNAVKRSIEADGDPLAELFLFVADHADHIAKVIKPAIASGKIIISDRYSDSRYAYQGATLSDKFDDAVAWVQGLHRGWTVVPDMTILLTIDPEVAVSRCGVRGEKTKFEKLEFLKKVQDNFLRLANEEPHRFVNINAGAKLETVELEAEAKLRGFLNAVHGSEC